MDKENRLKKLEEKSGPDKPTLTVCEEDDVLWINDAGPGNVAGLFNPDAPGVHRITREELSELEKTYDVVLIRFVDMDFQGPTHLFNGE